MPKELSFKLSENSIKNLSKLSKKSGLSKSAAASWVLKETAVPVIPRRSKESRDGSIPLTLDAQAFTVLSGVMKASRASESIVLESYLSREYV